MHYTTSKMNTSTLKFFSSCMPLPGHILEEIAAPVTMSSCGVMLTHAIIAIRRGVQPTLRGMAMTLAAAKNV